MIELNTIVVEVKYWSEGWYLHIRWEFKDTNTEHTHTTDFDVMDDDIINNKNWPWAYAHGFIVKEE